jgi:pimeloyl-ACP methyl ester carboxylesterase
VLEAGQVVSRALGRLGLQAGSDLGQIAAGIASLNELGARRAFVHTARSVLDVRGQRVDARDRLYLAQAVPSLLVWGVNDPIIPARHGIRAQRLMPGSRLELFEGAGHFPHLDEPLRFISLIAGFVAETEPADVRPEDARELMLARAA